MGKRTLLQMVQQACGEMGLPAPTTMASTVDQNAVQLLALANREAWECSKASNSAGGWQELRQEYTFQVQSTGIIPGCSFTLGSNVVTIGTPATQAPQVGWVLSTSGGSNATGFPYPAIISQVLGNQVTLVTSAGTPALATLTQTNTSFAFGQQSYPLPADFDWMISGTQWDRGYRWQVFGPLTPQEWQVLKSGLSPTGPRRRFRLMNGLYYLDPIPYDSNTLVYEYYSRNFALTGGVTTAPASRFATDADTYLLPEDLLVLGLKWRYRRAKGMDYTQEQDDYETALQREIGRDASARVLRLDIIQPDVNFLTSNQIPDTGFGGGQS